MQERSNPERRVPAGRRHLAGDLARLLREAIGQVNGPVALMTVTQPGEFDNTSAARRWRALCARLRVEMLRRHGSRSPRCIAWVCQRQRRGADHLHRILLCRTPDERRRVQLWVALYREFAPRYGFGFVDDPLRVRRLRDGSYRDMVFERGQVAGSYIGRYLAGGQLEAAMRATDRSWRLWWISPWLLRQSGWSLARCRWVRQGWHVVNGTWHGGGSAVMGRLTSRLPSWWFRPEDRDWVLAVVGIP